MMTEYDKAAHLQIADGRHFIGNTAQLTVIALDKMVSKLQSEGVENTPYQAKI